MGAPDRLTGKCACGKRTSRRAAGSESPWQCVSCARAIRDERERRESENSVQLRAESKVTP